MLRGDDGRPRPGPLDALGDVLRRQQVRARHRHDPGLEAAEKRLMPIRNAPGDEDGVVALGETKPHQRLAEAG